MPGPFLMCKGLLPILWYGKKRWSANLSLAYMGSGLPHVYKEKKGAGDFKKL